VSASDIHPQVRVFVRPYGSPIPLGFFAFGVGMFLYAALDAGWVPPDQQRSIGLLLLAFVAPLELLATVFAFLCRDAGSATALGLFGTSWIAGGLLLATGTPGVLSPALGYYLIAFTCVVLLLAVSSLPGKPLLSAFLLVSSLRGVFSAAYELDAGKGWDTASGWVAVAAFAVALYGGLAFLLEDVLGRTVLPLARRAGSRSAIEDDLPEQLASLADEAGVRRIL
jgi:succinate-acetate transporter protein